MSFHLTVADGRVDHELSDKSPTIQSSQWSIAHAILSPDASSLRTNFGVHTIGLSSLHLPWLSANFVIHSYSSKGKDVKKISWIFVYK